MDSLEKFGIGQPVPRTEDPRLIVLVLNVLGLIVLGLIVRAYLRIGDLVSGESKDIVNFMQLSERVGMAFWVRPEVPRDRVDILRTAFMKAMSDPAVQAEGAKRGAPINPIPGAKINKMVAAAYKTPKATLNKIKSILGFK